jgi:hypothetical protein
MGDPVRTGVATMLAVAVSLPTLTRAQSDPADTEDAMVIPVHPSTPTTLQLPDEIVDVRMLHRGEFLIEIVGQDINLRPRPDIPAGTEAVVIVETSTTRRRFWLRVVERREDAVRKLVLPAAKTVERTGEARPEIAPAEPAAPQPAESAPEGAPAQQTTAALQPRAGDEPAPEPTPEPAEPVTERAATAAAARAFALSVHALVSLGVTGLYISGYKPNETRKPYGALGLRLTIAPHDKPWALDAGVSAERLAGSMTYTSGDSKLAVSGSWLRAELGVTTQSGTRWIPSASLRFGLQAHLRRTEKTNDPSPQSIETLNRGAVLTLGLGLHYRTSAVSWGLEFQVRQGWPDDYFSAGTWLTLGRFLDKENEP